MGRKNVVKESENGGGEKFGIRMEREENVGEGKQGEGINSVTGREGENCKGKIRRYKAKKVMIHGEKRKEKRINKRWSE